MVHFLDAHYWFFLSAPRHVPRNGQFESLPGHYVLRTTIQVGNYVFNDTIAIGDLRNFETELYKFIETRHPQLFAGIAEKKQLDDQLKAALTDAVKTFAGDFAARKAAAA